MLKGFRDFLMRGNVVDLAVAVVIGAAFGAIVKSFVEDIITPIIAAFGGQPDFSSLTFTIGKGVIKYGSFLNAVVAFVILAAVIYFLVVVPMNRILAMRRKEEAAPKPLPEEVVVLREIRDLLKR
ncbi:MAG: large-conductance mechanosensitive channel protein MscL [Dehalococcoidia bacterium]